jgi:hypothetical protein
MKFKFFYAILLAFVGFTSCTSATANEPIIEVQSLYNAPTQDTTVYNATLATVTIAASPLVDDWPLCVDLSTPVTPQQPMWLFNSTYLIHWYNTSLDLYDIDGVLYSYQVGTVTVSEERCTILTQNGLTFQLAHTGDSWWLQTPLERVEEPAYLYCPKGLAVAKWPTGTVKSYYFYDTLTEIDKTTTQIETPWGPRTISDGVIR